MVRVHKYGSAVVVFGIVLDQEPVGAEVCDAPAW